MALDDFLDDRRCNICTMQTVQDAAGGVDREPYRVDHARVPVLVREMGGSRDRRNDKATQTKVGRLYFDADYGLTTRNRIQLLDAAGVPARELTVISVVNVN